MTKKTLRFYNLRHVLLFFDFSLTCRLLTSSWWWW